jgi:hypothetical protein
MKRLFGLLRVFVLSLSVLGVIAIFTIRRAEAQFHESLNGFGKQLIAIVGYKPHSSPRTLFVNGLEFRVLTVETPLKIPEALDRFQGLCHSVSDINIPNALRKSLDLSLPNAGFSRAGVVRQEAEREGYLGCLDVGAQQTGEGLLASLVDLNRNHNLASLGGVRYALARRHSNVTTMIVLWTEGGLNLRQLLPKDSDAPGRDLNDFPRPTGSQRLLSAFEQMQPFGLATYRLKGKSEGEVVDEYERLLETRGWKVKNIRRDVLRAEKDGRQVIVGTREKRSGVVTVSLSDLG